MPKVNLLHFTVLRVIVRVMANYMRKIPVKKHPEILRLYAVMSARSLAKRYKVSHQAIINIVRDNGGDVRHVGIKTGGK